MRATPVVTLVVILSLALGIGANTAMFSIVNSLLLRALPVERADQLVLLLSNPSVTPSSPWSNPVWELIRDRHADLFQDTFAFSRRTTRFNLTQGGPTDFVDGVYASGRYFDALRVPPMLGRSFTAEDDRRGGGPNGPVAVISYAFWQRRFGASADVGGRTQTIDRVPFTIVGVMPPEFFGTDVGSRSDVIGIRMAIGAAPARVVRLVLARVIVLLGLGVLIGTAASIWASRFIATLLHELEPRDPATLISSAAVLATAGVLAGSLPAYRASRVDPAEVLRES